MQLTAVIVGMLFIGWWIHEPIPNPPVSMESLTPEQQESIRKLLATPDLSPDEWQHACDPWPGRKFGKEEVNSHCSIQVVVDCPPDCGVYKILREDKLLRRIW